jgi:quinohemoprotein ethanol dehydrogenase
MPRLPQIDSACRLSSAAGAIVLSLAISCGSAFAEDLTPAKIKAVTGAVDGAFVRANAASSNDWPTIGLDYAETRFSRLNKITSDNVKGLGLVWRSST